MVLLASLIASAALALAGAEVQSSAALQPNAAQMASTPAGAPVVASADGDKVVCKSIAVTGTRFSTRECKTKDQWAALTRDAKDYVDRATTQMGCAGGGCGH